ncbi:FXYD domain-containing ion transport regulator 3 [Crocuta crocuta]
MTILTIIPIATIVAIIIIAITSIIITITLPPATVQEMTLSLLILLAGLPALDANDPEDKNSPFYYDWYRLRVGGLICSGVLCAIGIIVLMSGKCKCKFSQKPSHHPGDAPPLIAPGSAHNC